MTLGSALYVKNGSGAGAYKSSTGAMIYKADISESTCDTWYVKGANHLTWQTAYDHMIGTPSGFWRWEALSNSPGGGVVIVDGQAGNLYKDFGGGIIGWYCHTVALRYTLGSPQSGKTLTRVTIPNVTVTQGNYQFKILMQNDRTLPSNWSDTVSSPQYSGSDTGTVSVDCNLSSDDYLIVICSFAAASWIDPYPNIWFCGYSCTETIKLRYE